ncbi:phosphonoacetaldehyde hydrolase [Agathobaculum sp.]|uniref:phosphonoacetaldehyde hydrolase n=1 Tax=Agathobaculum sp. TaxID=2048138 RepID=UPI002A83E97C|nr:phosphonoacetaldehyde hydrolase [Agathobaculum sp.]MDY3619468.1 phosphonoacetaldehyde hydrolase [Agathobaculum sp.]
MIEAVILDWAGTAVDYGCFAPVQAFMDAFSHCGVPVTVEETRGPMGMLKRDHIRAMLQTERIAAAWQTAYGRAASEADVDAVYRQFEPKLFSILQNHAKPKPGVLEAVATLRGMGLKIGSTTGYTDAMMQVVVPRAAEQGYSPDFWTSPDRVGGQGRPFPYMVFENLKALGVRTVKNALKIGDTVSDIKEGVNAGVWTAGVIEGSSQLGLSQEEYAALPNAEREARCHHAGQAFFDAGAHFVLQTLSELPQLIQTLGA